MMDAHLGVHFGVVEHGHKLFKEGLVGDLTVEGSAAPVHQNVEQAQGEKDDSQLRHLQSPQKLLGDNLRTTKQNQVTLTPTRIRSAQNLLALLVVYLLDDLVNDFNRGPLVVLACGLLNEFCNLRLIHACSNFKYYRVTKLIYSSRLPVRLYTNFP